MIKPIAFGHPSNESGSRALSLRAIRLASGSMVTFPADAEPDLIDPGPRIPMELPTLCLSSHRSISFLSYKQRHPIRTRGTFAATCRSNVRREIRQYPAASFLVSRGDAIAAAFCSDEPAGAVLRASVGGSSAEDCSELGISLTSYYRFCPPKSCASPVGAGARRRACSILPTADPLA